MNKKRRYREKPLEIKLRNKLDYTFNKYIKLRDKKCILSGDTTNLQCSHYYGKKFCSFLRWDERNAHAMSRKIHFKHHHDYEPDYALWMFKTYGMNFMIQLERDSKKRTEIELETDPKKKQEIAIKKYEEMIQYYENKIKQLKGE